MKGILFKPAMIKAISEGRKTVTRRLDGLKEINHEPDDWAIVKSITSEGEFDFYHPLCMSIPPHHVKPRYHARETVYVKEAWSPWADEGTQYYAGGENEVCLYRSDYLDGCPCGDIGGDNKWHSPLFMPEKYARYHLQILDVRPERLQEITEEGAVAEGIDTGKKAYYGCLSETPYRFAYASLWDSINKDFPWSTNPWVWRIEFKLVT